MDQEYIAQTALDQMVGTDQGQLLKALIPYFLRFFTISINIIVISKLFHQGTSVAIQLRDYLPISSAIKGIYFEP